MTIDFENADPKVTIKEDPVLVTDGTYRGWVGYIKALGDGEVAVLLMDSKGKSRLQVLPYDYVLPLDPP